MRQLVRQLLLHKDHLRCQINRFLENSVRTRKEPIWLLEDKEYFPTEDSVYSGKIRMAQLENPSLEDEEEFRSKDLKDRFQLPRRVSVPRTRPYAGGQGGYSSQGSRGQFPGGRRGYPFAQGGYSFQGRGGHSSEGQRGYPFEGPKLPFPGGRGGYSFGGPEGFPHVGSGGPPFAGPGGWL
uniref:S10_plectin domain-containing protein n=1 Tax=Haemonchus placei TaxID=6290 RepID=A0A0N4X8F7_HAEPC